MISYIVYWVLSLDFAALETIIGVIFNI